MWVFFWQMAYHSDSKGVKRRASPEPDTEVRRLRAKTEQVIINPFTFLEIYHLIRSQNSTSFRVYLAAANCFAFLSTGIVAQTRMKRTRTSSKNT